MTRGRIIMGRRKITKKWLWVIGTLVLVLGVFVGVGVYQKTTSVSAATPTIVHSGKSGNLDWTIDSDGLLTISGSGDYALDYKLNNFSTYPSWYAYSTNIQRAVVNVDNITSTRGMFAGCKQLTTILSFPIF